MAQDLKPTNEYIARLLEQIRQQLEELKADQRALAAELRTVVAVHSGS